MGGHARFSPSSGKRRLECSPSLLLEEQFPDEESPFVAEGSAGHAMAEYLINKYLKKRTKRPVSDYYSDELLEAVDDYVEYNITQIEQARKDCDEPFIGVELKVSLAHRIKDCFGTADMVVVDSHKIHIIDLKLGKGVVVDAEQNVQLMIYGLGVLDMLGFLYEIDTVELTIVQRGSNIFPPGRYQQKSCLHGERTFLNREQQRLFQVRESSKLETTVDSARQDLRAVQGQRNI